MGATILALGHYAPHRRVLNAELEARLKLDPGWIEVRTGIRERRWVAEGKTLTDIATFAGELALERANVDRASVALTILATSTPDHLLPPSAPLLTHRLKLPKSGAIDMAGACAGFIYALTLAEAFVKAQQVPVLVVAANILSRRINFEDRGSAILFADAAGAVLLGPTDRPDTGLLGSSLASDGAGYDLIKIEAGGSKKPFAAGLCPSETLMKITDGRAVFAKAVDMMVGTARAALASARLTVDDMHYFVPHQANTRVIEATRRQLGVSETRVLSTVATHGNSSAASIPFSLSLLTDGAPPKPGDRILMTAAGAGLTGGAIVFGV